MENKYTFNQEPEKYEKFRPTYSKEMFHDLITYSKLDRYKHALEIGIGTGQATRPILETNCQLIAVELGERLAAYSKDKFSSYKNFSVINGSFEEVLLNDNQFDLVYSASAFHWIDPKIGLPKVLNLLKDGGTFAWLSNLPGPSEDSLESHKAIQKVYEKYADYFKNPVKTIDMDYIENLVKEKIDYRFDVFNSYGLKGLFYKTYESERVFTAIEYCQLLSTYSDHISMPMPGREDFLNEIKDAINKHGGYHKLKDIIILCMGRNREGTCL